MRDLRDRHADRRVLRRMMSWAQVLFGMCLMLWCPLAAGDDGPSGIVRIVSPQASAQVFVNNEAVGEVPMTRYLPVGSHVVRVVHDGFDPFVRRIQIQAGSTLELNATLIPGNGTVEFIVEPKGAALEIDGKDTWSTPIRLRDLEEREFSYTLSATGHEDQKGKFTFVKGKNLLFIKKLESGAGLFVVQTQPEGVRVWMNGEDVGTTPIRLEEIEAREHHVRLEHRGFATVYRTVDTSNGSKGEVVARMPKSGAHLRINTGAADASLTFEGMDMGSGRSFSFGQVERGQYRVRITSPGRKTIEQHLRVPANGRASFRARWRSDSAALGSKLVVQRPFYGHWAFWTAMGMGAGGAATAGYVMWNDNKPIPVPEGDLLVTLP